MRKGKTMIDYISREELLEKEKYLADWNIDLYYIDSDDVKMIPSADVRPNIHGHWIEHDAYDECSVCLAKKDNLIRGEFNFCPTCGADMREPKGEKGTE